MSYQVVRSAKPVRTNLSTFQLQLRESETNPVADLQAFSELFSSLHLKLTRFVRKHLKHPDYVDDVVQQAYLEAYRNWGSFRGESRPETWLFGIAFNLVRNLHTKQYRQSLVFEPLDEGHFSFTCETNKQPLNQLLRCESVEQLRDAIDDLPSRMQDVVQLVLLEGLSYDDAAKALKLPVGTVRSRLSRARDVLRVRVEQLPAEAS